MRGMLVHAGATIASHIFTCSNIKCDYLPGNCNEIILYTFSFLLHSYGVLGVPISTLPRSLPPPGGGTYAIAYEGDWVGYK